MANENHAYQQAEAQGQSIAAMVAALSVDYNRLEELRETRDEYSGNDESWVIDCPEDAEELAELEEQAGDCESEEDARQRIEEDALDIQVRSDWHAPGETPEPSEFYILLCTGGPAVRIMGELDQYNEPCRAWLEYQDWGTPWTEYHGDAVSMDDLLTYARCFYFGE